MHLYYKAVIEISLKCRKGAFIINFYNIVSFYSLVHLALTELFQSGNRNEKEENELFHTHLYLFYETKLAILRRLEV